MLALRFSRNHLHNGELALPFNVVDLLRCRGKLLGAHQHQRADFSARVDIRPCRLFQWLDKARMTAVNDSAPFIEDRGTKPFDELTYVVRMRGRDRSRQVNTYACKRSPGSH